MEVDRSFQGPDGFFSPQTTLRDLDLTLTTVKNVIALIEDVSPVYPKVLNLFSLTTLVAENFLPKCRREGNDMPLVTQYAHR